MVVSRNRGERFNDFTTVAGVEDSGLQPHYVCGRFHVSSGRCACSITWIDQQRDTQCARHKLPQQAQLLCHKFTNEKVDACRVASWSGKAVNQTKSDRILVDQENDGNRCSRRPDNGRGRAIRDDHGHLTANKIGR